MIKHTGRRGKELGLECFFFVWGGGVGYHMPSTVIGRV